MKTEITSATYTIHKTREPEMGYANIAPGIWMFISLQGRPSQVGYQYASKAELLADKERYLASWGY